MKEEACHNCRYNDLKEYEYPCLKCKTIQENKFEPIPDLKLCDLVIINDCLDHDNGFSNQVGIVMKVNNMPCNSKNENYYYVVAYDNRAQRYWSCGFDRSELTQINGNFNELIIAFKDWSNQTTSN